MEVDRPRLDGLASRATIPRMSADLPTADQFAAIRAGDLVDRPREMHDAVAAVARDGLDATTFGDLVRALSGAYDLPYLADAASEASLIETLLLAAASVGCPLDGKLADIARESRAVGLGAPWRLGNVVVRHDGGERDAHVVPLLAVHLACNEREVVREHVADVIWDRLVAARVESTEASAADIARCLLDSPARHLARFPESLPEFGHAPSAGPADLSPARLLATVAPSSNPVPSAPMPARPRGTPAPPRGDEARALLRDLDTAPAAWRRSAALLQLLTGPRSGEIGGVELDLHREAAARIGVALIRDEDARRPAAELGFQARDWLRFEVAALRHGAEIAARAVPDDAHRRVRAAWLFGDWIGRVMRESPFLGADPDLLAARLEAVLPDADTETTDALWPARMGTEPGSLRLDEVWLLHALFLARERGWEPPGAVLDGLRTLAQRPVNDAERGAEQALEDDRDALEWPGAHLAPPLAARWLLHASRAEWLSRIPNEAQHDTIAWLARWLDRQRASRGAWVMLALYREGAHLDSLRDKVRELWIKTLNTPGDLVVRLGEALGPFCLWGSTYLAELTDENAASLARATQATSPAWRVGVLLTLAESPRSVVADPARDALLALIQQKREPTLRLPAAVASLQLVRKLPDSDRESFLTRVEQHLDPGLRAHPNIRVELKRVGRAA